jgi:alcohol dehydrogenase
MRAVLVNAPNETPVLTTVADPDLPPHGAIIEVRATGVCRSDWHAWVGHDDTVSFPHVPGHEFAGVVRAVGAQVRAFSGGERVTAPFCCGCGACSECQTGHQNLCLHEYQPGFDGWGSFAELVMVPWADTNLVTLPEGLGFDLAASLGCRFTTAYAGLTAQAALQPGESVVVYGCGGVGLSAVAVAAHMGARVIAVDIEPGRLALARELGAEAVIDARSSDPVAATRDLTHGGAHVSVDALGSAGTAAQGVLSLRRRGRHLQLGLLLGDDSTPRIPLQAAIKHELRILGSHGMQARRYPEMLSFVERSGLPLEKLIGERRPLEDAGSVLASMGSFAPTGVTILMAGGAG